MTTMSQEEMAQQGNTDLIGVGVTQDIALNIMDWRRQPPTKATKLSILAQYKFLYYIVLYTFVLCSLYEIFNCNNPRSQADQLISKLVSSILTKSLVICSRLAAAAVQCVTRPCIASSSLTRPLLARTWTIFTSSLFWAKTWLVFNKFYAVDTVHNSSDF